MNELTEQRIGELVVDALERTAFVLVDIISQEDAKELPVPTNFTRVAFTGAANGSIILSATDGFLRELASSILGVDLDEVEPDVEGRDGLNELANIVGGSVILEMGGADSYIKYGLPCPIEQSQLPTFDNGTVMCHMECDGELLVVAWYPQENEQAKAA